MTGGLAGWEINISSATNELTPELEEAIDKLEGDIEDLIKKSLAKWPVKIVVRMV